MEEEHVRLVAFFISNDSCRMPRPLSCVAMTLASSPLLLLLLLHTNTRPFERKISIHWRATATEIRVRVRAFSFTANSDCNSQSNQSAPCIMLSSSRELNTHKRVSQQQSNGSKNKRKLLTSSNRCTSSNPEIVLLIDRQELNHSALRGRLENSLNHAGVSFEYRQLPVADYLWIIKHQNKEEYVLPFLIERKSAVDLARSVVGISKTYPPLTRAEVQLYKMKMSGIEKKTWLIQGHVSEKADDFMAHLEREREFQVKQTTKDLQGTIDFLVEMHSTATEYVQSHPPSSSSLTYFELDDRIDNAVNDPSFKWKLRLLQLKGIGNLEADAIVSAFSSEATFKQALKRFNGERRVRKQLERLELKPGHALGSTSAELVLREFVAPTKVRK